MMKVLNSNELNHVSGGWVAHAAGAVLGGYAGGYGYLAGGGKNPDYFLAAIAGGAVGGAINPVRGIASGAKAVVSGVAGGAVTTRLSN